MLNLNSKGFTFDDRAGGKDPLSDLKSLLAGAYASCTSFENCLQNASAVSLHEVAEMCRDLQTVNINLLKQALVDEGVQPDESADFWHSFAGFISTTAALLGEDALLVALRKNELDLFSEYESKISSFDGEHLVLVQQNLIPNQMKICELLGAIRSGKFELLGEPNVPLNLDLA